MAVLPETLEAVKVKCRISHNMLDEDLTAEIEACKADLEKICGINAGDETDPLILNAIKLWCKSATEDDTAKAAAFRQAYDSMKACLQMASDYKLMDGGSTDE